MVWVPDFLPLPFHLPMAHSCNRRYQAFSGPHVLGGEPGADILGADREIPVMPDNLRHGSVAHPQLLAERLQLVRGRVPPVLELSLVREQVRQKHTSMRADFPARDRAFIEELHQVRP